MSSTVGLTSSGFITPSTQDLVADLQSSIRTAIGPSIDLSADQPMGQIVGIFAQKLSDVWNGQAALYGMLDPNQAEGVALDNLCALTGTTRPAGQVATVAATVTLGSNMTLPAGSLASVTGYSQQTFMLLNNVSSTAAGTYSATFVSTTASTYVVQPGTLTVIVTPVSGWSAVTNSGLGTAGSLAQTDTQLRNTRVQELAATGGCNADALRGKLLEVSGVISATIYENKTASATSVVTTGGTTVTRSPHTSEAVIWDGASPAASSTALAQTIFTNKPAGISSVGASTYNATDSTGTAQPTSFTRATGKRLFVLITVQKNANGSYAGDAAVQQALVNYIASTQINPGTEVVALGLKVAVGNVAGVFDITSMTFDFSASPSNTGNLFLAYDAVATLALADVTVTSS